MSTTHDDDTPDLFDDPVVADDAPPADPPVVPYTPSMAMAACHCICSPSAPT